MRTKHMRIALLLLAVLLVLTLSQLVLAKIGLGKVVKVGGIAFLVKTYDKQIDNFINKSLGERKAQAMGATKVVPIVSVGRGGYIGAAQVVGVPAEVQKVQAVVQVEIHVGSARAKAFFPTTTKTPKGQPKRMESVGVSAMIETKI